MILTDREIEIALRAGRIVIDPQPQPDAFSSTTVDLTLSEVIRLWNPSRGTPGVEDPVFAPAASGYRYTQIASDWQEPGTIPEAGLVLERQQFLLAWTHERVELPTSYALAARVEGKSSLARLGIGVHVTAPTIHSGFAGQIQLELFNFGPLRVRLTPRMRVCQLIFEMTLGIPQKGYAGMFANQIAS